MIIILNGPPGVGKDTIGNLLAKKTRWQPLSFKTPMWDLAKAALGQVTYEKFCAHYNDRDTKEAPQDYLGGFSPREFFIHISERWCKPVFGDEYFGERLLRDAQSCRTNVIVTDGGFPKEVIPMLQLGMQVLIVRLHREGYSFAGDSRDYIRDDAYDSLPSVKRPTFLDIEVKEGIPEDAAWKIFEAAE